MGEQMFVTINGSPAKAVAMTAIGSCLEKADGTFSPIRAGSLVRSTVSSDCGIVTGKSRFQSGIVLLDVFWSVEGLTVHTPFLRDGRAEFVGFLIDVY